MSTDRSTDSETASRVVVTMPTKSVAWWLGGAAIVLIAAVVG